MKYTGETNSKGEPQGHGTLMYAAGSTHPGEWQDGRPED